jgi:RNA polymerase sigma-70 factor, ECF subfamily
VNDDQRLVAAAVAGSERAGAELFARHWVAAWRVALSVTGSSAAADDIAQDAFERAFRGLAGFNGQSSFRTWLSRIVLNRAIDVGRREQRSQPLEVDETLFGPWSDDDVLRDRDLLDAVAALAAERRTVVALRYGHSTRQLR